MMRFVSLVFLLIMCLLIITGCSRQKKEDLSGEQTSPQSIKTDTTANLINRAETDSPLVTFIELGSVKCVPCKMMQPVMDEIEKEYAGQVRIVFHDVWTEEGRPYAEQYGIRAIPTQIFLDKTGKEYFRHTGFFPKENLVKILEKQGVQ